MMSWMVVFLSQEREEGIAVHVKDRLKTVRFVDIAGFNVMLCISNAPGFQDFQTKTRWLYDCSPAFYGRRALSRATHSKGMKSKRQ